MTMHPNSNNSVLIYRML